jgi:hypothetical protein
LTLLLHRKFWISSTVYRQTSLVSPYTEMTQTRKRSQGWDIYWRYKCVRADYDSFSQSQIL